MLCLIPLRNKQGDVVKCAIINADDRHLLQFRWHANIKSDGSVRNVLRRVGGNKGRWHHLHHAVLGFPPGTLHRVDHINRNPLDCRRSNLRLATTAENLQNLSPRIGTSRYRGVSWYQGKWHAEVRLNYQRHKLGAYDNELEAAEVAAAFRREHMPFSDDAR